MLLNSKQVARLNTIIENLINSGFSIKVHGCYVRDVSMVIAMLGEENIETVLVCNNYMTGNMTLNYSTPKIITHFDAALMRHLNV